jgi:hypothetical protein
MILHHTDRLLFVHDRASRGIGARASGVIEQGRITVQSSFTIVNQPAPCPIINMF